MLRERATTCIGQKPIDQFVSAVASDLVLKSTKNTKLVGRLSRNLREGKTLKKKWHRARQRGLQLGWSRSAVSKFFRFFPRVKNF